MAGQVDRPKWTTLTVHGVGLPDEVVDAVEPGGDVRLLAVDNLPE